MGFKKGQKVSAKRRAELLELLKKAHAARKAKAAAKAKGKTAKTAKPAKPARHAKSTKPTREAAKKSKRNASLVGDTITSMFPLADMARMQKGATSDIRTAAKFLDGKKKKRRNPGKAKRKRNSGLSDAKQAYASFHGTAATKVAVVNESEYIPTSFSELGLLVSIKFRPAIGGSAEVTFDTDNAAKRVMLCEDPKTNGLYFVGGDQSIQLRPLGLEAKMYHKPMMILGQVKQITYRTKKGFDRFVDTHYWHNLGEETGDKPTLVYSPMIKRLYLAGGAYNIRPEGIVN